METPPANVLFSSAGQKKIFTRTQSYKTCDSEKSMLCLELYQAKHAMSQHLVVLYLLIIQQWLKFAKTKQGLWFIILGFCIFKNSGLRLFTFSEASETTFTLNVLLFSVIHIAHLCIWPYLLYFSVSFLPFFSVYLFYPPLFSMISVTQSPSPALHVQWQHRQGCMPESRHHA